MSGYCRAVSSAAKAPIEWPTTTAGPPPYASIYGRNIRGVGCHAVRRRQITACPAPAEIRTDRPVIAAQVWTDQSPRHV